MGRPLNKKYFGNRNIGTGGYQINGGLSNSQNYADDRIGGEGIDSINVTNGGNYINRLPTIATFGGPSEPGGVQAAGVLHSVAINCNPNARGTGYQIGDVLTDANGTTWRVTKLRVISASLNTAGSSSTWDGTEWIVWDQFIDSHWTSPTILKGVTADGGHHLTGYNAGASVYGVWDGTDGTHAPTTAQAIVGGPTAGSMTPNYNTRASGDYNGSGVGDNNGTGGSVTFTWGIEAAVVVSSADYAYGTSYAYGASNTTTVAPAGGTGAKLDVGFAASYLAVTEKGSGYIGTETIAFTSTSGGGEVTALGGLVLTTDSGGYINTSGDNMNANNQENAILIYAKTTSGGTVQLGDIIKQSNARSYKVRTADGISVVKLIAGTPAFGQATITATDSAGGTYYVTKLTAHRALLTRNSGTQFATGQSVKWTFGSAVASSSVTIANA